MPFTKTNVVLSQEEELEESTGSTMMNERDWEAFKEGATMVMFKTGDIVFSEGTPTGSMYQIARGTCRIVKRNASGENVTLRTCSSGEIIGEISFIEGGAASASVVSDSDDCVVYVMTRDFVEKALVNNPGLTGRFYKFLATLLADRLRTKKTVSWVFPFFFFFVVDIIATGD
jgi:CRP-like cAMP-binding protein